MKTINAYCDGACRGNPGLCSVSFVVYKGEKLWHKQGRVLEGKHSNNEAEYVALLDLLKWADKNAVKNIAIYCDSTLIVYQVTQKWSCNKPELKPMCSLAYGLMVRGGHTLKHVKGHNGNVGNEAADALCNELLNKYKEEK